VACSLLRGFGQLAKEIIVTRVVYHLVHKNEDKRWHLERGGTSVSSFPTKNEALACGTTRGIAHHAQGLEAQLVVHQEDGSIDHECNYDQTVQSITG
jgi:Uncharacterized protein conserved in bacteria (DUF2188)